MASIGLEGNAYDRVSWRGVTLTRRTATMAEIAEDDCGITLDPVQGSFVPPSDYSASTHSGAGAVDFSTYGMTEDEKRKVVRALRDAGFAAWLRRTIPGLWNEHIHCIAIGERGMSTGSYGAAPQVDAYKAGGDGLAPDYYSPDPMPYRPDPIREFNFRKWQRRAKMRARVAKIRDALKNVGGKIADALKHLKSLRKKRDDLRGSIRRHKR